MVALFDNLSNFRYCCTTDRPVVKPGNCVSMTTSEQPRKTMAAMEKFSERPFLAVGYRSTVYPLLEKVGYLSCLRERYRPTHKPTPTKYSNQVSEMRYG
jgi:hypothetical protein